MHHF